MMKNILVAIAATAISGGAGYSQGLGTQSSALAGAVSVTPRDPWSMYHNPGGLAELNQVSCSSSLSPGEFGLPELRTVAGSVILPVGGGVVGLGADQFGFDLYKETSIVCGYGAEVAGGFRGGLSVRYRHLSIKGYGTDQSGSLQAGGLLDLTSSTVLGFRATNITATTVGRLRERLPQTMALGVRFESENHFLGIVELEKDIRYPLSLRCGVRQRIAGIIELSAGCSDHPLRFSAGMEIFYGWISIGWAGYHHADLGWTHQLGLTLEFGQ